MNVAALPTKTLPGRSLRAGTNRRVPPLAPACPFPATPTAPSLPRRGFALRSYWRATSHPVPDRWDRGVREGLRCPGESVQGTGSCKVTRFVTPVNTSANVIAPRFKILALHGKSTTIAGSPSSSEEVFKDVGKAFSAEGSILAVFPAGPGLPARLLVRVGLLPIGSNYRISFVCPDRSRLRAPRSTP